MQLLECAPSAYAGISLWQWYGLKAFNKDLNEYQNLQKLVFRWIF